MKAIPISKIKFDKLIREDCYYVDKTKMIEELRERKCEVALFPRPRRFGKTLTLSMLENFFDIEKKVENQDLFKGLYIEKSSYYKERGEYPVISISFKNSKKGNFKDFYEEYIEMMSDLYTSKKYVCDILEDWENEYFNLICSRKANVSQYQRAIQNLTGYLKRYYNKEVVLLIDEYDVPIQDGYLTGYYEEIISFMKEVFISTLKDNKNLMFAVITGVLRVSKETLFSGLNNVDVYGLMNSPMGEYFGFTESETKALLEYYNLSLTDKVKKMYDGYNFNGVEVYNPWSILNYANRKTMDSYWVNTSGNDLIKKVISECDEENKRVIEELVQGESHIFVYNENITYKDFDEYNNLSNLLNLLYASGYLTLDYVEESDLGKRVYVKIPNDEVKEIFVKIMTENVYGSDSSSNIWKLTDAINDYDLGSLEKVLNEILIYGGTYHAKEMFYEGFMLGIFSLYLNSSNYIVNTEREAGLGRYDVMIKKKDHSIGYIFELKIVDDDSLMEETSKKALEQIKEKKYYQELVKEEVKKIYTVSIVFGTKNCIVRGK